MKRKFLIPFVLACLTFSACSQSLVEIDDPVQDGGVEDVVMNLSSADLEVGKSVDLFVAVTGEFENVTWLNGDPTILSLSHHGTNATVTALNVGSAYVTAIVGTKSASCKITVGGSKSDVVVSSITMNESAKTLAVGETGMLVASLVPANSSANVAWTVDVEGIVELHQQSSSTCLLTAIGEGRAVVTATAAGKTTSAIVTVIDESAVELSVRIDKSSATVEVDSTIQLTATVKGADEVLWQSNNESAATVDQTGKVTGVAAGSAKITATVTDGEENATAECNVTVTPKGSQSDYEASLAAWSKPGHLYLHYLRENGDYDAWALWIWQKLPNDLDGSLWGATKKAALSNIEVMSDHWMKKNEIDTSSSDTSTYCDAYGQIVDVDLTADPIIGGKSGEVAPLIDSWDLASLAKARLGFLIVDQTKMGGGSHWTSDGSADTWIKKLDEKFPSGADSYLHIYCVEGAVNQYTTSGGAAVVTNPTLKDESGDYRSQNDINNLKADAFTKGVSTSETFLNDRPGTGYQIFVPSFADGDGDGMGDLRGIINKLDYLDKLGIDVLWLTPIQESDSYHGYDVTDYYKIDSKFGTMEDYQELIFKAHQRGMKVLMDMVINHTSKNNVLFQKSQRAETEKIIVNGEEKEINYRNMYLWKFKGDKVREWDGVIPDTSSNPNATAKYNNVNVEDAEDWYQDGTSNYYYFGKFGSGMAELNYSCQATRDYMTDMCKYWLSFGLDGFRLDAIKHIYLLSELDPQVAGVYASDDIRYDVSYRRYYDNEMEKWVEDAKNDYSYDRDLNVMFWKQFAGVIKSAYPNCFLVGENFDGWNERIAPFYSAIDSQFDFSTYYHLNEITMPASIGSDIKATLGYNKAYRGDHINGAFTSNHDIARLLNHAGANGDTSHTSEISSQNATLANNRARYFAAATILTPGVSWIYYGDEIGMSGNLNDKVLGQPDDHGNNVDRWYRQPMRWGATQGADQVTTYTFSGLPVVWDNYNKTLPTVAEQETDPNSMLNFFKAVCATKQSKDYPTYGQVVWSGGVGSNTDILAMQLSDGQRTVNVFINNSDIVTEIEGHNRGIVIGSSFGGPAVGTTGATIPAHGFVVVKA